MFHILKRAVDNFIILKKEFKKKSYFNLISIILNLSSCFYIFALINKYQFYLSLMSNMIIRYI